MRVVLEFELRYWQKKKWGRVHSLDTVSSVSTRQAGEHPSPKQSSCVRALWSDCGEPGFEKPRHDASLSQPTDTLCEGDK